LALNQVNIVFVTTVNFLQSSVANWHQGTSNIFLWSNDRLQICYAPWASVLVGWWWRQAQTASSREVLDGSTV
jgi:hypothetical protein